MLTALLDDCSKIQVAKKRHHEIASICKTSTRYYLRRKFSKWHRLGLRQTSILWMMSALTTPLKKKSQRWENAKKKLVLLVMEDYINKYKGLGPSTQEVYAKHKIRWQDTTEISRSTKQHTSNICLNSSRAFFSLMRLSSASCFFLWLRNWNKKNGLYDKSWKENSTCN